MKRAINIHQYHFDSRIEQRCFSTSKIILKMKKTYLLLLCVLSTFHFVHSQLYPVNHEVVYNYKGMVQSGTGEPITFVSDFAINAKVHVKGFENYTLVTIEDMTYGLYSGKNSEFSTDKMNFHDIPEPSKHIYKPFIINYNIYGKTIGILTENDDKMWSVNIKRAIASLLQLNVHRLDSTSAKASGFYSDEHTIYGICNVLYDVVLTETNKYNITKHITTSKCKEYAWKTNFNVQPDHCDVEFKNPISTFAYIDYSVEKTDSGFMINNINAKNNIYLNTLNGHTDTQFVLVDQTLDYERQSEFSTNPKLETITNSYKTRLHFLSHAPDDKLSSDVTGDRPGAVDMDLAMTDAMIGLHNVVDHMRQHQIELSISFEKQGRAVHFLLFKLRFLNEEYLTRFHKKLEGDTTEVGTDLTKAFLQVLPLLGTYESHIFIRNLIWQNQISQEQSIELMKELPFNIKYYSKKIWKEFSLLTSSQSNITEPVRHTIMLAISNLISRYNHMYPDDTVVTNYVDTYIDMFKKSKTERQKILLISALSNIKTKKVLKFIEEIVQSESEDINPHIKTLATLGFKDKFVKNKDLVYKLYWPIFKNNNADLELRSAAMIVLIADASMETMLKMYWHMQSFIGHNVELYKSYYTAMESMSQSKTVCNQLSSLRAKRIFKHLKKPKSSTFDNSINMIYDYYDSKFGFGAEIKMSIAGNILKGNFLSFYAHISPQIANLNLKPTGYYVYIKHKDEFSNDVVYKGLLRFLYLGKIDIEIITLNHGQITSLGYYNSNYIRNIFSNRYIKEKSFTITQSVTGEHIMPTLIGVPVAFNIHTPTIDTSMFHVVDATLKFNSTTWKQQTYGIEVYNPIEDSWHGCRRFHIFESNFPLDLNLYIPFGLPYFVKSEQNMKQFGVQTFVFSDVFLSSDHQNLESMKSFCGDCKPRYIVSQGEQNKKKHVIIKNNSEFGFVYDVSFFECEQELTMKDLSQIKKNILQISNKNWGGNSLNLIPLILHQLWGYSLTLPGKGMCGFGVSIIPPLKSRIITRCPLNYTRNYLQSFDITAEASLTLEGTNDQSYSYEIQFKSKSDDFAIEAIFTGEKNYKICINSKKNWNRDEFDQQLSIYAGHNFKDECDYNDTFVGIVTKGMKSKQQITDNYIQDVSFERCETAKVLVEPITCIAEHTNLRRFEYHIIYKKLPLFVQKYAYVMSDVLRYYFTDYFERVYVSQDTEDIKLTIEYPFDPKYESKTMDLHVQTKNDHYKYKDVPYDSFSWMPFVKTYSRHFTYFQSVFDGLIQYYDCHAEMDHITNIFEENINIPMSSSWVDLVHDEEKKDFLVSTKNVNDKMVLRINLNSNTLDVTVKDNGLEVLLNDKILNYNKTGFNYSELFHYKVANLEHKIFLVFVKLGSYIEFNGKQIKMVLRYGRFQGKCFELLNEL